MPKLVRLGNTILSSVPHSTEYLHHSFFPVKGRQPRGRPSDAHFLCPTWDCSCGSRANGSLLSPSWRLYPFNSFLRNHFLLLKGWLLVLTGINSQKWVGVNKHQPAAMIVQCFCSTSGEKERGLSAG